jgi:diadenosine tetraphosphatase ApaH/serine/threonine PP2A family protein phosphatase
VHGNAAALDAVLADARGRGADRWLLGGDYCLFGPEPEAALERLRALSPAMWLRGNGERWCAAPDDLGEVHPIVPDAIAACRETLGAETIEELGGLAGQGVHEETRYCHGSPPSDVRSFLPQPAPDEAELLEGVEEPRLVFGHTHLPFRRISMTRGIELVNPGSVGLPFDRDPRAAYALVHDDRSVEHRRIPYDHGTAAARMRERWPGTAWAETVARRIEQSRPDV